MSEEYIPLTIFQGKQLQNGNNVFDFGAGKPKRDVDILYDYDESFITKELIKYPSPINSLFQSIGINFPQCWILIEIKTHQLIKDWKENKPGDIDIVIGNISKNKFLFNNIFAIQIKLRKTTANDELRPFPSGRGTKQTHYTSLMGFDKTILLHCFTREPKPTPSDYADSWNPIINSDFFRAIKASKNILNQHLSKGRNLFGYAVLGWGQSYGHNWNECGGFSEELIYDPPYKPLSGSIDVSDNRAKLEQSIKNILNNYKINKYPFVLNFT